MNSENIICLYSRKEALEDGTQILVDPDLSKKLGIKLPIYFLSNAWDKYVKVYDGRECKGQTEEARLKDLLNMFKLYWQGQGKPEICIFKFSVTIPESEELERNEKREFLHQRLVTLKASFEAKDFDDNELVLTISKPQED